MINALRLVSGGEEWADDRRTPVQMAAWSLYQDSLKYDYAGLYAFAFVAGRQAPVEYFSSDVSHAELIDSMRIMARAYVAK
jgi:hypothetical protein